MKRGYFTGWKTVYSFSLTSHIRNKSFKLLTVIFALLLLAGVVCLLVLPNAFADNEKPPLTETALKTVIVCDKTADSTAYAWLSGEESELFGGISYNYSDKLALSELDTADSTTLVLLIEKAADGFSLLAVTPESTVLTKDETDAFINYVTPLFRAELIRRSGIDPAVITELTAPVETEIVRPAEEGEDPADQTRYYVNMIASYIIIFVMYFMILFYGQGVANSVILEKTSKLMDFFLVSVKPAAMILGKVLASVSAALIQILSWILGIVGGVLVGSVINNALYPTSGSILSEISTVLAMLDGIISPVGTVIALLVIIAGFLLYCSLAAVGGAMASKPEDLSSTNSIFAMVMVASFLLSLYSGSSNGMVSTSKWLIYFPFTAILVTPGRALTGSISITEGIISLILVALTALVVIALAGKTYEMMSFYRGNLITPAKLFRMISDNIKASKSRKNS